ncbi:PAQR family membrane homeostasis protein TrhA [Hydrogenimonas urashimensis]|uniref:PAQR family membrane homeostasis protein TrhA n=1 Tax=Hydrogenimonas urashimensis TaxID=2740515 RepID=UPI0019158BFA|nr:hemolysin III family protein [Hydrogenimonas urashimensis]
MREEKNAYSIVEEIWHAISHGFGLFLSTFGFGVLVTLAAVSGDTAKVLTSIVFGIGLITMYGASILYHAITHKRIKSALQIFDHVAIYILIAATYTPVVILGVRDTFGWILFGVIWGMAIIGILLKLFFPGRFEIFSLILYGSMGWLIVVAWKPLVLHAGWLPAILLFAGGIIYTVGIFFYARESMRLNHAIWHLFVLGGSIFHYFTVFLLITQ